MEHSFVEPKIITSARKVLDKFSCQIIDPKDGSLIGPFQMMRSEQEEALGSTEKQDGVLLDVQTANMLVLVYENITPESQSKFQANCEKFGVHGFVNKLWTVVAVESARAKL